jgi:hypothetical protein
MTMQAIKSTTEKPQELIAVVMDSGAIYFRRSHETCICISSKGLGHVCSFTLEAVLGQTRSTPVYTGESVTLNFT